MYNLTVSNRKSLPRIQDEPEQGGWILYYCLCILNVYIWRIGMAIAKVFKSGNSQAVRLPKDFQFDVKEVEIFHRGEDVVLRKKKKNLTKAFEVLGNLPKEFMADGRKDTIPQSREF